MKSLLFAIALALSCTLIVMVSAQQCDSIAATTCANDFTNMVSKDCMAAVMYTFRMCTNQMHNDNSDLRLQISDINTNDTVESLRIIRDFCQSDCVTTILPACRSLDPSSVDQIMQGNLIINL